MRTRQDILDQINAEADKFTVLKDLQKNTSRIAFWGTIKNIIAFAIATLEVAFQKHLDDVQKLIKNTEPGTADWYKDLALKFQSGHTIQTANNLTAYAADDADKRIIKRVSITDNTEVNSTKTTTNDKGETVSTTVSTTTKGGFVMKVAKQTGETLAPLSGEEKRQFSEYIRQVKLVGVPITVVSLPADKLSIVATIELDNLLYKEDGRRFNDNSDPIKDAINDYLQTFPFDEQFYLSKLIDAVQAVEGVIDVEITKSVLNAPKKDDQKDETEGGTTTTTTPPTTTEGGTTTTTTPPPTTTEGGTTTTTTPPTTTEGGTTTTTPPTTTEGGTTTTTPTTTTEGGTTTTTPPTTTEGGTTTTPLPFDRKLKEVPSGHLILDDDNSTIEYVFN